MYSSRPMINSSRTPQDPTRFGGNLFWDPYGSKSSPRHIQRETHPIHNVSVGGDTPFARKDYTYRAVSTPSMQSRAQFEVGLHPKRPSLRTAPSISIPIGRSATFPRVPRDVNLDPQRNTRPPRTYQFQNSGAPRKGDEGTRHDTEGTLEGGERIGDEDPDEEESSDDDDDNGDSDNDNEEYESEGDGTEVPFPTTQPRHLPSQRLTTQNPRAAFPGARQSYVLLPETNGLPQIVLHPVPQEHHNRAPSVTHNPPTEPSPPHSHHPLTPETRPPRPVSSATSRTRPQNVPENPRLPNPGGSNRDAAGTPTVWGEGSPIGVPERRSLYSERSNSSAARSIWLEQQVARREEEAARREEEANLKEEEAQGLEIAARKAFAWVQSLEARVGRIHDTAMQAEARAKRIDAVIWERAAEVLRRQAEMAKREVEVARREIAVQRAEQEVRRKEREARRKEEELSLKEDAVRNKEQEALRMEEEVHQKKTEIKQSKKKLSKRRAAEVRMVTKDTAASAWAKIKGRISRNPHTHKQDLSRIPQYEGDGFDGDDTTIGPDSSSDAEVDSETSTWVLIPVPCSTLGGDQDEPRSTPIVVTSGQTTPSAQYTVTSVHSYKERVIRGPFRRKR